MSHGARFCWLLCLGQGADLRSQREAPPSCTIPAAGDGCGTHCCGVIRGATGGMCTRARLLRITLCAAWNAGAALADEPRRADAPPPAAVVQSAWVEGGHVFADAEAWISSSALSGDPSGLAGTDVTARPGYGFRLGGVYLVGRAHAVVSTIFRGARLTPLALRLPLAGVGGAQPEIRAGWSDPALALSAPALLRSEDSTLAATPTFGLTVPTSRFSPVTRAVGEIRAMAELPSTGWAFWARGERVVRRAPQPLPIRSFQREFSCTTQNLECLLQRPSRESWSARVTALVELRPSPVFSAGVRMSAERVALASVPDPDGGAAPANYHDGLTFTVHAPVRVSERFGLAGTITDAGRPLSPGHPLRLPLTEISDSF